MSERTTAQRRADIERSRKGGLALAAKKRQLREAMNMLRAAQAAEALGAKWTLPHLKK